MPQSPSVTSAIAVIYCASCAKVALIEAKKTALSLSPGGKMPQLVPIPSGSVRRRPDGSWQVPAACAVSNGESVCMLHLSYPMAAVQRY